MIKSPSRCRLLVMISCKLLPLTGDLSRTVVWRNCGWVESWKVEAVPTLLETSRRFSSDRYTLRICWGGHDQLAFGHRVSIGKVLHKRQFTVGFEQKLSGHQQRISYKLGMVCNVPDTCIGYGIWYMHKGFWGSRLQQLFVSVRSLMVLNRHWLCPNQICTKSFSFFTFVLFNQQLGESYSWVAIYSITTRDSRTTLVLDIEISPYRNFEDEAWCVWKVQKPSRHILTFDKQPGHARFFKLHTRVPSCYFNGIKSHSRDVRYSLEALLASRSSSDAQLPSILWHGSP